MCSDHSPSMSNITKIQERKMMDSGNKHKTEVAWQIHRYKFNIKKRSKRKNSDDHKVVCNSARYRGRFGE